jgi:hypothetical protein
MFVHFLYSIMVNTLASYLGGGAEFESIPGDRYTKVLHRFPAVIPDVVGSTSK